MSPSRPVGRLFVSSRQVGKPDQFDDKLIMESFHTFEAAEASNFSTEALAFRREPCKDCTTVRACRLLAPLHADAATIFEEVKMPLLANQGRSWWFSSADLVLGLGRLESTLTSDVKDCGRGVRDFSARGNQNSRGQGRRRHPRATRRAAGGPGPSPRQNSQRATIPGLLTRTRLARSPSR